MTGPMTSPTTAGPVSVLTVEAAAIRIGDAVFTLPRPNRHHNIIWWLDALGVSPGKMHDQGFVLSNGQYVSRTLAAKLALRTGQVTDLHAPPNLFSEDLWDGGADLPTPEALAALTAPPPTTAGSAEGVKLDREQVARAAVAAIDGEGAWDSYAPDERARIVRAIGLALAPPIPPALVEALRPFAALADKISPKAKDDDCWCGQDGVVIRYRDIRAAALAAAEACTLLSRGLISVEDLT